MPTALLNIQPSKKKEINDQNKYIYVSSLVLIYGRDILSLVLREAYTEVKLILRAYEIGCIPRE